MAKVVFKPDIGGIREVFRGEGVQNELAQIVADIERACTLSVLEDREAKGDDFHTAAPFASSVDIAKWTAIGEVRTISNEGYRFENKTHIMESFNH